MDRSEGARSHPREDDTHVLHVVEGNRVLTWAWQYRSFSTPSQIYFVSILVSTIFASPEIWGRTIYISLAPIVSTPLAFPWSGSSPEESPPGACGANWWCNPPPAPRLRLGPAQGLHIFEQRRFFRSERFPHSGAISNSFSPWLSLTKKPNYCYPILTAQGWQIGDRFGGYF